MIDFYYYLPTTHGGRRVRRASRGDERCGEATHLWRHRWPLCSMSCRYRGVGTGNLSERHASYGNLRRTRRYSAGPPESRHHADRCVFHPQARSARSGPQKQLAGGARAGSHGSTSMAWCRCMPAFVPDRTALRFGLLVKTPARLRRRAPTPFICPPATYRLGRKTMMLLVPTAVFSAQARMPTESLSCLHQRRSMAAVGYILVVVSF